MKTIVGLIGITLMGFGICVIIWNVKVGFCAGVILLGAGLVIDAVKR